MTRKKVGPVNWGKPTGDYSNTPMKIDKIIENARGLLPPSLNGLNQLNYGGMWGNVAHQHLADKARSNILNDGTADEIVINVKRGNQTVSGPVKLGGLHYNADKNGNVRICDRGRVKLANELKEYERNKIDAIMEDIKGGDDIAAYVFNLSLPKWLEWCSSDKDPNTGKLYDDKDMQKLNCSIAKIDSMVPSLTQQQHISKLRHLVRYFAPNYNLDDLTKVEETKQNAKDGKNTELEE